MDLSDYKDLMQARTDAMEVEDDRREIMREVNTFLTKKGGQWEQTVWDRFGTYQRPRYTFDRCRPIRNQIWGEIADNEFQIKVRPSSTAASDDTAEVYSGIIRAIESRSKARWVYSQAGKKAIDTGFSCWRVEQDWADTDSFDQDLFIRAIHDAVDRVWFLGNYQEQTAEDAPGVIIEHEISEAEAEERFPGRTVKSLGASRTSSAYYHRRSGIRIGELIYKKPETKTIYKTESGEVVTEEDAVKLGLDTKTLKSRKRETYTICVRFFDAEGWLSDSEETVFSHLPVIPVLPNFEITDNKPISMGAIEGLMDQQRVINYGISRKVEDTALSPKPKLMISEEQAAGRESKLATMNNNNDPAFVYRHEEGQPPPYYPQVPGHNAGLSEVIAIASQGIEEGAGMFGPNLAKNEGLQSGVAIRRQQHKGDLGTIEYFKALEVAIAHTGKVLVKAIPRLIPEPVEYTIMKEDGTPDVVMLYKYDPVKDVVYNDLKAGVYDVECDIGPAFSSRREETATALVALGNIDPTMIMMNSDILLNSQETPGMKLAAERARAKLIKEGVIPEWQLTDEEKERIDAAMAQAAANPPPPDPMMVAAQAEADKAKAQSDKAQYDMQRSLYELQQKQQQIDFDQQKQKLELMASQQADSVKMLKDLVDILKGIKDAQGMVPSPKVSQVYDQQAEVVSDAQEQL